MDKMPEGDLCFNQSLLTKCIFKGMTLKQTAREMGCAISTVSYYLNQLYAKYNAKTRNEFQLNVLAKIINSYKETINRKNERIVALENEVDEARNILSGINSGIENPIVFDYWINESKKFI